MRISDWSSDVCSSDLPTIEDTVKILAGLRSAFENHHKVKYTPDAIKSAVELSARYINDRKLPDKAIDVIDEVGAMQMLVPPAKRRKTITSKEIRSEEHTSELQSLMRISYAVFCLKNKKT